MIPQMIQTTRSDLQIYVLYVIVLVQNTTDSLFLVEMQLRVRVGQLDLHITVAYLALHLPPTIRTCVLMYRDGLSNIFFCIICLASSSDIYLFIKWKGGFVSSI